MAGHKRSASKVAERLAAAKKPCYSMKSRHGMVTRSISTRNARNAVFETRELFEGILQQLPLEDLLFARCVCKTWYKTIGTSKPLMRKLFLLPEPKTGEWVYEVLHHEVRPYHSEIDQQYPIGLLKMHPARFNPMLFKTDNERPSIQERGRVCENMRLVKKPTLSADKYSTLFHHMYICQPPVEDCIFVFQYRQTAGRRCLMNYPDDDVRLRVRAKGGVKFGHLVHKFLQHVGTGHTEMRSNGYHLKVKEKEGKQRSVVWMLGALFANEDEKKFVESQSLDEVMLPSPLASKMMGPGAGAEFEKGGYVWSNKDDEYVATDATTPRKAAAARRATEAEAVHVTNEPETDDEY